MLIYSKISNKKPRILMLGVFLISFFCSFTPLYFTKMVHSQSSYAVGQSQVNYQHNESELMEHNLADLKTLQRNRSRSVSRHNVRPQQHSTDAGSDGAGKADLVAHGDVYHDVDLAESSVASKGQKQRKYKKNPFSLKQKNLDSDNKQISQEIPSSDDEISYKLPDLAAVAPSVAHDEDALEYLRNFENSDNSYAKCVITPEIWDILPQPPIYKTNNLLRKVGSAELAQGTYIYIEGRVLDNECNPIADALVQIWQADGGGEYYYTVDESSYFGDKLLYNKAGIELDSDRVTSEFDDVSNNKRKASAKVRRNSGYDANFTGSGAATSNNQGKFVFITIMPEKAKQAQVPKIHFAVQHRDFYPMQTAMFFPEFDNKSTIKSLTGELSDLETRALLAKPHGYIAHLNGFNPIAIGQDGQIQKYAFDVVLKQKKPF